MSVFWWMSLAVVREFEVMHVLKRDTSLLDSIVVYVVKVKRANNKIGWDR